MSLLPVLILTYFEPFGGRTENQSEQIARALESRSEIARTFSAVKLCRIPVVYDLAARVAWDCIRTHQRMGESLGQPIWVVSLGEYPGNRLRIETAAHNWDSTPDLADNAGVIRKGSEIIPGAEPSLGFRFPMTALFSSPKLRAHSPLVSATPGAFLCNHLAYQLTRDLAPEQIPYLFVHIGRESDLEASASALTEALVRASTSPLPEQRNPVTLKELRLELDHASSDPDAQWWLKQLESEIQE